MKKITRNGIERDLVKKAQENGMTDKFYLSLINDYMTMWDAQRMLEADIAEKGAKIIYISNNGTKNEKRNESIDQFAKVNAQMLKLLDQLKIKPDGRGTEDDVWNA